MRYDHVELLAPAGSMDSLKAALFFGANAVYAGGPFLQLRAGQTAFDLSAIAQAADLCHERGARLYIAANAFTFPEEIEKMGYETRRRFFDQEQRELFSNANGKTTEELAEAHRKLVEKWKV